MFNIKSVNGFHPFIAFLIGTFVSCCMLSACHEDHTFDVDPSYRQVEKRLAIVGPLSDAAMKARLERTAQWFEENFKEAQQGDTVQVCLKLEWYDEKTANIEALSRELSSRNDVVAVVGPFGNEAMAQFVPACQQTHKPIIAPTATCEDLVRRYAVSSVGKNDRVNKQAFFWPLCETDVILAETMLGHYATSIGHWSEMAHPNAAIFSPDNMYGQTFYDWMPFHARNMNIELLRNVRYGTTEELKASVRDYLDEVEKDAMENILTNSFCVVQSTRQLCDVVRNRIDWFVEKGADPTSEDGDKVYESLYRTWFVFPDLSQESLDELNAEEVKMLDYYQGFIPYADKATGFETAYMERFGTSPTFAEAKLYDALLLVGLASRFYIQEFTVGSELWIDELSPNEMMNFSILLIGVEREKGMPSNSVPAWRGEGLRHHLDKLKDDEAMLPPLWGASGYIVFDKETCSQLGRTTYVQWQIVNGSIQHNIYYGPQGKEVVNENASWDIFYDEETAQQDFANMATDKDLGIVYPAMSDQYAVLVQGSNGMDNYRHQADVLSVYQLLRRGGFDDDHIILILDGALANDRYNKEPGIIRNDIYGPDLLGGTDAEEGYPAAVVDYDSDSLSAADISDILLGKSSSHLPVTLPRSESSALPNVLLYWSGHGRNNNLHGIDELSWRDEQAGRGMTSTLLRQTVEQMAIRKMLVITEPCYSEGVITQLQGLTGVLAMSSASGDEQSWAENWNPYMGRYGGVWMCDRFTHNLVSCLTEDASITYRGLYLYCMSHTIGSHVKLVNADHFGNLYNTSPYEFVVKTQ